MRLIRFMCEQELRDYLNGETLTNNSRHQGLKTTSVGFCFAEVTPKRPISKWLIKLGCLVSLDYVVEFDSNNCAPFSTSSALYASDDPDKEGNFVPQRFTEYCTTTYSLATFPFKRIGIPDEPIPSLLAGRKPHVAWVRDIDELRDEINRVFNDSKQ